MVCYLCGSNKNLHVHHIDWHHENNDPSNRMTMCERCHVELHRNIGYLSLQELTALKHRIEFEYAAHPNKGEWVVRDENGPVSGHPTKAEYIWDILKPTA
jgi:hypothetical protein